MLFANINPIDKTILINDIIEEIQQNEDENFELEKFYFDLYRTSIYSIYSQIAK